jgi:hypothetical protein
MNIGNKFQRIGSTICLLFFVTICAYGQTDANKKSTQQLYKTGKPSDWPKSKDAVVAAPGIHKVLLENDSVRVLEVTLLPGQVEPLHHHQFPSVLYVMEGGDFLDRDGDGNVIFDSRKLPSPPKLPMAIWQGPEALHSVENLSKTIPIRLIRVEIKM